jgi:ferrochelatase
MSGNFNHEKIGVLLMGYGSPDSLDDFEAYFTDIRGGRKPAPELVEEIKNRYRLIGGKSPLLQITQAQAQALQERLNVGSSGNDSSGPLYRVYLGMRHWHPYIKETFKKILQDDIKRLIALALAPQYSRLSVGAYIQKVKEAEAELNGHIAISYVESWHTHPLFLEAIAQHVKKALDRFPASVRNQVQIIFTAHSLPERILAENDPYPQHLQQTVEGVLQRLGPVSWHFAYQSQGRTAEKWLGPNVETMLEDLWTKGYRNVLLVPIGFVSDHVEILYDIDILFKNLATSKGMHLERIESLNTDPLFIEALASVILEHLAVS